VVPDPVATVLTELGERLSREQLVAVAPLSPVAWAQRLGHLLDCVGWADRAAGLADYVQQTARDAVPLDPRANGKGTRDPRWKLAVNVQVAPDL